MDRISKEQRSKSMSAVKGRGNKSTEQIFLTILKKNKINGWRRNLKNIPGKPDFIFLNIKTAIFIDGCFWHGCKKHFKAPQTNVSFWKRKIEKNIKHDKIVNRNLKKFGWKVLRFWEHEINKSPQ
jgi:DNA mismatch endonuclease (patch repair protein)